MKINVKHTARLANLKLTSQEEKKFEEQLSSILDYVYKLQEVDTENTEETSQVTGLENVTREDTTSPSLSQEEALSNAKPAHNAKQSVAGGSTKNGLFKVKGILSNE